MNVPTLCPEHGRVTASLKPAESAESVYAVATCGCKSAHQAGTETMAPCPDHGPSYIIFTELCSNCKSHGSALLACGCQGRIFIDPPFSIFHQLQE